MSFAVNKIPIRKCFQLGQRCPLRLSSTQTDTRVTKSNKESNISVKNIEKYELEKVIKTGKSGQYMDRVWETNVTYRGDKEQNKITDPYFLAHKPLSLFIEATYYHDWGINIDGIKRRLRNWINYREENQQKYYSRRHANLGQNQIWINHLSLTDIYPL